MDFRIFGGKALSNCGFQLGVLESIGFSAPHHSTIEENVLDLSLLIAARSFFSKALFMFLCS